MFRPLKVTFKLDGTGVYHNPADPIHLDALLSLCASIHFKQEQISRADVPVDFSIPCARWKMGGTWGFRCSALFPEGPTGESVEYMRKKFRQASAHLTTGSPVLTNATYREYNIPMPLVLTTTMVAYCVGERRSILVELRRNIRHLGRKRAAGRGRVNEITVEEWPKDWSLARDGRAMRWLPRPGSSRVCRPRPPYWNPHYSLEMCEIGDEIDAPAWTPEEPK